MCNAAGEPCVGDGHGAGSGADKGEDDERMLEVAVHGRLYGERKGGGEGSDALLKRRLQL